MANVQALLPLLTLIILAVTTKRMGESLLASMLLSMLLLHKGNIVRGTLGSFYSTLADPSFQFCIIFLLTFGIIMKLFQESGGLKGFADFMTRFIKSPRSALVFCWIMDIILFIDEYLDALTVSFSMRRITDSYDIPREHLAFHVNAMACSLCLAVPMTSWTAFIVTLIEKNGMGLSDYIRGIPMMFYPVLMIILCLLLALGVIPKLGNLKKAYGRVRDGGPTLIHEKNEKSLVDMGKLDESKNSSPLNILVPLLVIIAGSVIFDRNMLNGLLLGIVCQFILYLTQKLMTISEFFENLYSGASSMLTLLMIIFFGFVLNDANEQLGLFDIVVGFAGESLPPWMLPAATFLITGGLVFATGSCWMIMLLAVPIFIPLANEMGVDPVLTLAALMSGIGLGYSTCFYGDTIFLSAAGTEVSNMTIIKTTLPYALILIVLSTAGYLILGLNI